MSRHKLTGLDCSIDWNGFKGKIAFQRFHPLLLYFVPLPCWKDAWLVLQDGTGCQQAELLYDRHWGSPSLLRREEDAALTSFFKIKTTPYLFCGRRCALLLLLLPILPKRLWWRRRLAVLSISLPYSGVHPSRCFGKRHDVQHVSVSWSNDEKRCERAAPLSRSFLPQ